MDDKARRDRLLREAAGTIDWAIDLIEMYDEHLIEEHGDPEEKVRSEEHLNALRKAKRLRDRCYIAGAIRDAPSEEGGRTKRFVCESCEEDFQSSEAGGWPTVCPDCRPEERPGGSGEQTVDERMERDATMLNAALFELDSAARDGYSVRLSSKEAKAVIAEVDAMRRRIAEPDDREGLVEAAREVVRTNLARTESTCTCPACQSLNRLRDRLKEARR